MCASSLGKKSIESRRRGEPLPSSSTHPAPARQLPAPLPPCPWLQALRKSWGSGGPLCSWGCAGLALPSPAACCSPCHPLFLFTSWRSFLSLLLSCTKEHLPGQQKCLEITTAASPGLWGKRMRRWFPSVGAAWGTHSSFVLLGEGCLKGRLPRGLGGAWARAVSTHGSPGARQWQGPQVAEGMWI